MDSFLPSGCVCCKFFMNLSQTHRDCIDIQLFLLQVCLLGKSRSYQPPDEAVSERRRTHFIQSRQPSSGVQRSDIRTDGDCCHGNTNREDTSGGTWGAGFQPRDKVERVRNCAALPRDFIDKVVLRVANALLEKTGGGSCSDWNQGGKGQNTIFFFWIQTA